MLDKDKMTDQELQIIKSVLTGKFQKFVDSGIISEVISADIEKIDREKLRIALGLKLENKIDTFCITIKGFDPTRNHNYP